MKIKYTYNLTYYTPKWWEAAILRFVRLQVSEKSESTVWFKQFFNRLYIYGYFRTYDTPRPINAGESYDNAGNN